MFETEGSVWLMKWVFLIYYVSFSLIWKNRHESFFREMQQIKKRLRECCDGVVILKLTFLIQVLSGRQYSFLLRNMKANDLTHFVALDYLCTPLFSPWKQKTSVFLMFPAGIKRPVVWNGSIALLKVIGFL